MNSIGFFPSSSIQGPSRLGAPGGFAKPPTFGVAASLQAQLSFFSQSLNTSQNLFNGWSGFGGGGFANPGFQNPFVNPGFNKAFTNPGFNKNFTNPGFNMNFRNPGFNNLIFAPGINTPFPQHPGFNLGGLGGGASFPGFDFLTLGAGGGHPGFSGGGHPGFSGGGHPGIANNPTPYHLMMQGVPPIPMF